MSHHNDATGRTGLGCISSSDCATRGGAFARLEHLKRHERSHTKGTPFECPECKRCLKEGLSVMEKYYRLSALPHLVGDYSAAIPIGAGRGDVDELRASGVNYIVANNNVDTIGTNLAWLNIQRLR